MANPVGWFEVTGPDAKGLQDFYSRLFGWSINVSNEMNYGMVQAEGGGIPGGVGPSPDGAAHVNIYIAVDDLQAALDKATELGGQVTMPPMDVPDGPTLAFFADPAGNQIGLMKL